MHALPLHHAVRGIAACWVAVAHLMFNPIYNGGFATYRDIGWLALPLRFDFMAVDFFFLLSGCLLTLTYRSLFEAKTTSGAQIDRFYLLRLGRIYPLHLAVLLCIFISACSGMAWPKTAGNWAVLWEHRTATLAINLTLMHAWGIIPVAAWNEPAWTISVFLLLYVIFPNLIYLLRRFPAGGEWLAIALLIGSYTAQRHLWPVGGQSDGVGAIIRGMCFFSTGIMVARLHQRGWAAQLRWALLFLTIPLVGVLMLACWAALRFDMGFLHLLYPWFLLACLRTHPPQFPLFSAPLFYWLGSRAYAIYLLHYPVMVLLKQTGWLAMLAEAGTIARITAYLLALLAIGMAAELGYRGIERPCHRWVKNRVKLLANAL